jgi:hypothetical protein
MGVSIHGRECVQSFGTIWNRWKNNTGMFLAEIRRDSVDSTGSGYRQLVSS